VVKAAYDVVRTRVSPLLTDRSMSGDIQTIAEAVRVGEFDSLLG
jgi:histidine ammonia-lyase